VLVIERASRWRTRWTVSDDDGPRGLWKRRRRLGEAMMGELDGNPFELRADGRNFFALVSSGTVLAAAHADRRNHWTVYVEESARDLRADDAARVEYELRQTSAWHSDLELRRGGIAVGSIRKRGYREGGALRSLWYGRPVLCDLPAELSLAVQTFIGFVVIALRIREQS